MSYEVLKHVVRTDGPGIFEKRPNDVAAWVAMIPAHCREYPPNPLTYIGDKDIGVLVLVGSTPPEVSLTTAEFEQLATTGSFKWGACMLYLMPWSHFNAACDSIVKDTWAWQVPS